MCAHQSYLLCGCTCARFLATNRVTECIVECSSFPSDGVQLGTLVVWFFIAWCRHHERVESLALKRNSKAEPKGRHRRKEGRAGTAIGLCWRSMNETFHYQSHHLASDHIWTTPNIHRIRHYFTHWLLVFTASRPLTHFVLKFSFRHQVRRCSADTEYKWQEKKRFTTCQGERKFWKHTRAFNLGEYSEILLKGTSFYLLTIKNILFFSTTWAVVKMVLRKISSLFPGVLKIDFSALQPEGPCEMFDAVLVLIFLLS